MSAQGKVRQTGRKGVESTRINRIKYVVLFTLHLSADCCQEVSNSRFIDLPWGEVAQILQFMQHFFRVVNYQLQNDKIYFKLILTVCCIGKFRRTIIPLDSY